MTDADRTLSFDHEAYEWDAPDGPPDGRYVAEFTEALDGPTRESRRATLLTVYDVRDGDPTRVGHATVVTDDVPGLVPGERPGATVFEVTVTDGRLTDVSHDPELDERWADVSWLRSEFGAE